MWKIPTMKKINFSPGLTIYFLPLPVVLQWSYFCWVTPMERVNDKSIWANDRYRNNHHITKIMNTEFDGTAMPSWAEFNLDFLLSTYRVSSHRAGCINYNQIKFEVNLFFALADPEGEERGKCPHHNGKKKKPFFSFY